VSQFGARLIVVTFVIVILVGRGGYSTVAFWFRPTTSPPLSSPLRTFFLVYFLDFGHGVIGCIKFARYGRITSWFAAAASASSTASTRSFLFHVSTISIRIAACSIFGTLGCFCLLAL
jgi:hypothetical protein